MTLVHLANVSCHFRVQQLLPFVVAAVISVADWALRVSLPDPDQLEVLDPF